MGSLVRYLPMPAFTALGFLGAALAVVLSFFGRFWLPLVPVAVLLVVASLILLYFVLRAPIEIHDSHLQVGRMVIPWETISHVQQPLSLSPLLLPLILNSETRYTLVYPGSRESGRKLLRQVRRHAHFALIEGLPYGQYWDEELEAFRDRCVLTDQSWHVLSPDDECEVEQLFQKLRSEGTLHRHDSEEQNS